MATNPLHDMLATLTATSDKLSEAAKQLPEALQSFLKQCLNFNNQECTRTMITGIPGPNAEKHAKALDNVTRKYNNHNQTLKLGHNLEDKPDNTPRP